MLRGRSHRFRYRWSGPVYDVLSLEWPVYRGPRLVGMDLLRLGPGDAVLDVGCGTGLNFPLLRERVGPAGLVVGVDASAGMLRTARRRVHRAGWDNVVLLQSDAAVLDPAAVRRLTGDGSGVDAVVATYALSVMSGWEQAWRQALACAAPGAHVVLVELGLPTGRAGVLSPLARLACAAGGADPARDPGRLVRTGTRDPVHRRLRGGHVLVDAGTLPG